MFLQGVLASAPSLTSLVLVPPSIIGPSFFPYFIDSSFEHLSYHYNVCISRCFLQESFQLIILKDAEIPKFILKT